MIHRRAGVSFPRRFHLLIRKIDMRNLRLSGLGVLLLAVAASVQAAPPALVRDLAAGAGTPQGSFPHSFQVVGNRVVFVAGPTGFGTDEIWSSDSTEAGTRLLADVCPGPCSSGPQPLGRTAGLTFWIASPGGLVGPAQLWRSDGTLEGTWPLPSPEHPLRLNRQVGRLGEFLKYPAAVHQGSLYLGACGDDGACGIWRTDGTPEGTVLVTEQAPGPPAFDEALSVDGALVFRRGKALWTTDGTPEGTALLAEFATVPRSLTAAGRRAFFVAPDVGDELWVTDGTPAGTRPVTDFPGPRAFGVDTPKIKALGNRAYVVAYDAAHGREIWRSNGTPAGTRRITDLPSSGDPFSGVSAAHLVAEVGDRIVVQAADRQGRRKLWSVRGNGPTVALEIRRDRAGYLAPNTPLFATGGRVLFPATPELLGQELWSTDGTSQGTKLIRDFCPGACGADIESFWPVSRGAAFVAREGSLGPWQVWTSDGTAGGTLRESDFTRRGGASQYKEVVEAGGLLFFAGRRTRDIRDTELWAAEDGHARLVKNIAPDTVAP